jgi:hypothetical protein
MPETLTLGIKKYKVHSLEWDEDHLGAEVGTQPIQLSFDMQEQLQTQWCWAATSASVSFFYDEGSKWTQCLVTQEAFGSDCCQAPSPCNKPWYLEKALAITNNFVKILEEALTFKSVEAELAKGRVIGVRVGWLSMRGHFIVIYGCNQIGQTGYYDIDDSLYGKSIITESGLLSAYMGSGEWTHSYITKP